jgi:hypothetical protein
MIKNLSILTISLWFIVTGCSSDSTNDKPLISCENARGDVCTQEYKPVCARHEDGSKISYKTISNGCTACMDYMIVGYTKGECEVDKKISYIVMFKDGIDTQKEIDRLSHIYDMNISHTYTSTGGFAATMSKSVFDKLKKENSIKNAEEDQTVEIMK